MATVNVRFWGGPHDGETTSMDVPDVNNPPESYSMKVHGPHETIEVIEYRRRQRDPDGRGDTATWIYELSE
jgi:hypothetical protein